MEEALERPAGNWVAVVRESVRLALPIVLGYVPVGFAFGVLAVKSGMSALNAGLMSVFVFAGSGQLIAVGLLAAGAPALSVVLTTFVVNLRHLLMSAALAPHLASWPRRLLALFCFQMTDETFALHLARFQRGERDLATTLGVNMTAQAAWVAGSVLGALSGSLIGDVRPLGLDFALPAMFIALLCGQLKGRPHLAAGVSAAGLALLLPRLGLGQWSVLAATALAATLGMAAESVMKKPAAPRGAK
ncbi:MAG: AzlC family ABC transporter permease [Thermodesulfobacteriota bacterium]